MFLDKIRLQSQCITRIWHVNRDVIILSEIYVNNKGSLSNERLAEMLAFFFLYCKSCRLDLQLDLAICHICVSYLHRKCLLSSLLWLYLNQHGRGWEYTDASALILSWCSFVSSLARVCPSACPAVLSHPVCWGSSHDPKGNPKPQWYVHANPIYRPSKPVSWFVLTASLCSFSCSIRDSRGNLAALILTQWGPHDRESGTYHFGRKQFERSSLSIAQPWPPCQLV